MPFLEHGRLRNYTDLERISGLRSTSDIPLLNPEKKLRYSDEVRRYHQLHCVFSINVATVYESLKVLGCILYFILDKNVTIADTSDVCCQVLPSPYVRTNSIPPPNSIPP